MAGGCGGRRQGKIGEGARRFARGGPGARLERNLSGGGGNKNRRDFVEGAERGGMAVMGTAQLPRPRCLRVCARARSLLLLPRSDPTRVGRTRTAGSWQPLLVGPECDWVGGEQRNVLDLLPAVGSSDPPRQGRGYCWLLPSPRWMWYYFYAAHVRVG